MMISCLAVTLLGLGTALALQSSAENPDPEQVLLGHSSHGEAFDEGPRQKPWRMEGIGRSHFPITTSDPAVQQWFDQGNTLLHSFWYYEAERAFRWCLRLDPDCAMAYWGLARSTRDRERARLFLREAVRRKEGLTHREQLYLEAWEEAFEPREATPEGSPAEQKSSDEILADHLELLILEYPDDLEAKALFVLKTLYRSSRYGNELILQEILQQRPEHPGAHHYRIHNWDGPEGAEALSSCAAYGRIGWRVGHANHMPGHIYSGIGMWQEAAIWMDSATRVEKLYMRDRMIFPFNNWNYAHNRNYLSYIQENLGMVAAALDGARQLLSAPLDPKYNNPDEPGYCVYREGLRALCRALVKFERWEEILAEGTIPWRDTVEDKVWRTYCEAVALLGRGDLAEATDRLVELRKYRDEVGSPAGESVARLYPVFLREVQGLLALQRGKTLEGLRLLSDAAERELKLREEDNDPPDYPRLVYNLVGEAYLQNQSPLLAIQAFEKALEVVPNGAIALAGLTRAHAAAGDESGATEFYGRLLHVYSGADAGLRWREEAAALNLEASPKDVSSGPQRDYVSVNLEHLGPRVWEPYDAPFLDALNSKRERVTLNDYRGQNVLLVFYLGQECAHCVDQLMAIKDRKHEFAINNVALLAISTNTPAQNAASETVGSLPFDLLTDGYHANARRFKSYDDFEDKELHSTILIDAHGKVRWARSGGPPFMDLEFLLAEVERINATQWQDTRKDAGS